VYMYAARPKSGLLRALAKIQGVGRFTRQRFTGRDFEGETGRMRARCKGPANFFQAGRSCHYTRDFKEPPMQQPIGVADGLL
jgi:hypothetical protein